MTNLYRPEVSLGYSRDQKSLILCEVLHPVFILPNRFQVDSQGAVGGELN